MRPAVVQSCWVLGQGWQSPDMGTGPPSTSSLFPERLEKRGFRGASQKSLCKMPLWQPKSANPSEKEPAPCRPLLVFCGKLRLNPD